MRHFIWTQGEPFPLPTPVAAPRPRLVVNIIRTDLRDGLVPASGLAASLTLLPV